MKADLNQPPRPFPFYPPQPTEREMTRMELMMELNKWDNNNKQIAKRHAETLIELLTDQFLNEDVLAVRLDGEALP